MMAIGLGVLRLRPADFWAMTPRELAAAIDGATGHVPGSSGARPTRAALDALMRRFPDVPTRSDSP